MTINGGGKLLGNVSAEMVIITENGSIKGDVACKMLKVGFEASIIGRIYVHLSATSGSKIVMKEESISVIENDHSEMRSVPKSSERAESFREESNLKEGLPSLKIMTPTGKDKKVKEIKDIKNMRHLDDEIEKRMDNKTLKHSDAEETILQSTAVTAKSRQLLNDTSKPKSREVDELCILKDQVEGLIESERERGREREQSTILENRDRLGKEIAVGKATEKQHDNEVVEEDKTGKDEAEKKDLYNKEERGKEDRLAKEAKKVRKEKEKFDRQCQDEKGTKRIAEEKCLREIKVKADGKGDIVDKEIEEIGLDEQRITAKVISANSCLGMHEDGREQTTDGYCIRACTKETEKLAPVENASGNGKNNDGVHRKDEKEIRLGYSERTADSAELIIKENSSRRIETEENALRAKEVESTESLTREGAQKEEDEEEEGEEGGEKWQVIPNIEVNPKEAGEITKEEMIGFSKRIEVSEIVNSNNQINNEELRPGNEHKPVEKSRMQEKKERNKSSVSDVTKSDKSSREEECQQLLGDMHSVGSSPLARKASTDINNRSTVSHIEGADQRVTEGPSPEKGRKREIREERRRLSKFISQTAIENAIDKDKAAENVKRSEGEGERVRAASSSANADIDVKDMIKVAGEGNRQPTNDEEGDEQDSLNERNQQHMQIVTRTENIGSRPGSHIPAPSR